MAEITSDLMYELLKGMQGNLSLMRSDIRDVKQEINAMRGTMVSMQQDIHDIYGILFQHGDCLDRIEWRLDLRELAEAGVPFDYSG
ncbi:hypothetical protein [Gellertiella hungarica]|uniref:Uncharacterized protein n=1 Tax=Gellertiella hungarica TaxID=1572859 RepID=A0A7W6NKK9_9HYPH|nr:hypothetical protein [Gellertiella hungarica]MBB4064644.1 hypothetical protein [Gellertiella hungarica]